MVFPMWSLLFQTDISAHILFYQPECTFLYKKFDFKYD